MGMIWPGLLMPEYFPSAFCTARDENQAGNLLFALFIPDDDFHDVFVKLSPGILPGY